MIVDLVLEADIALAIGARLAFQHDRSSVRHDEPVPDQERSRLAEGDLRIVLANQAGALRDQACPAGGAVVDIFRHLGRHLAGQVRAQAGEQRRWDDSASLENIWTGRRLDTVAADRATIDIAIEKGELSILHGEVASRTTWQAGDIRRNRCGRRALPD